MKRMGQKVQNQQQRPHWTQVLHDSFLIYHFRLSATFKGFLEIQIHFSTVLSVRKLYVLETKLEPF